MFYRLGHFRPQLGSHDFESLLDHPEASGAMLDALEEMLQARLSRTEVREGEPTRNSPSEVIPDLLTSLPPDSTDRPWVTAVHDRLVELERNLRIRLLACEYEPDPEGFLCIAGTSPSIRGRVRFNDDVQAGFVALRDGNRGVRLASRVFRLVCANGSIVSEAEVDGAVGGTNVQEALSRCFDRGAFHEVLKCLVASAARTSDPMKGMGDEWERLMARHGEKAMQWYSEAVRRLRSAGGRTTEPSGAPPLGANLPEAVTAWGAINALTEVARDLPDWRERFDLEEAAGRLARLHRPVPSRTPGKAQLVTA